MATAKKPAASKPAAQKKPSAKAAAKSAAVTATPIAAQPEFDFFSYCELSGETRLDHELLEELEPRFDEWLDKHLRAVKLEENGTGYVLLWLEEPVESEVEGIWQDSPSAGMAFHNLAIHMLMSAVQGLVPELAEKGCAPLPKPSKDMQKAFKKLGLTWNKEGTVSRQFAVFTYMPALSGCGACMLREKCDNPAKD